MDLAQRIGPVERFFLADEYVGLAATAIRMRHKHALKLAQTRPEDLSDGQLTETILRLKAWIAEQPPLPIHPDSRIARRDA